MAAEKSDQEKTRRRTIPIYEDQYAWWTHAVDRELDAKNLDQKTLAAQLNVDQGALSKCINRIRPTYELLIAISDALKIAYPVLLPESEGEADHLATQKRLYKRDVEADRIKAGVAGSSSRDQGVRVVSEHAVSTKAKAPSPPRRKRKQRQRA